MRTVFTVLTLCLACCAGYHATFADEQEEKKQREEREQQEKDLAEWDSRLEKEAWAISRKQLIAELIKHLDKTERIELLRVSPKALPKENKEKKEFHGREVLFEVQIEGKEQRKEAATFLGKTLHWNTLRFGSTAGWNAHDLAIRAWRCKPRRDSDQHD